jgi:hypothetical protein
MSFELSDAEVEAEARSLLRKTILNSGWYPELSKKDRQKRIEEDVERYWHLMIKEASQVLNDRFEYLQGLTED